MSHARKPERPVLLIVAGPNGSGKSSAYQGSGLLASGRAFWIINPDLLAARIRDAEGLDLGAANLQAVQRIEEWLQASIRAYQTIGVETVLSTGKYRPLVESAQSAGFDLWLSYVILDSPQRNLERVRTRVENGGHAVPEDKVVERYARSLAQLPWFLTRADQAWVYDNSGASPSLVLQKRDGVIELAENALPAIVEAARATETA